MTAEKQEPMRFPLCGGPEDGGFVSVENNRLFTSIPVGQSVLVNGSVYVIMMDGRAHFAKGQGAP